MLNPPSPNPTNGLISFNKEVDVKVYTVYGKQIINKVSISKIDLSKYSNGIYNINVIFRNKKSNHRIIKQ